MSAVTAAQHAAPRPALRGWIHLGAFALTPALAATLIAVAALQGAVAALGTSVYCASMAAIFGVSALYHRRAWSPRGWQVMRRLDHATIFLFIAGTYTPFGLLALTGATRWWVLGIVWIGCAAGIAIKVARPHAPRWVGVPIYVAVGWVGIIVADEVAGNVGVAALVLLLVGGLLYTLGGVVYATHRPTLRPDVFGYHELFHLLTVLAAACQSIALFFVLARAPLG